MTTTATVERATERPGVNIAIGERAGSCASAAWTAGAWTMRFRRLTAHECAAIGDATHVKVITGRLAAPDRGAYPAPGVVRTTGVDAREVTAGAHGALVTLLTASASATQPVADVTQLAYSGPLDDALRWTTFEERYTKATPYFDGLAAHLAPGFHLLDDDGAEIAHVFTWAAGKGVDMSTHDHGRAPGPHSPAFAEVHLVLHNGTGAGGMYVTPEPGSPQRDRTPMPQGTEHGPFFRCDAKTGRPHLRDNGAVDYPWHSWEAGPDDGTPSQAYDVVMAFEITAPYARVEP